MMVEDHPEYREIVALSLGKEKDMEVVSQFGTAERALRSASDPDCGGRPDIILLDLHLPGMSGLESISNFRTGFPSAKIIVLTQSDREEDVLKAIRLGAAGYLLKSSTVKQLTEGIHTVREGGALLDSKLARFVLETLKTNLPVGEIAQALSKREMEILALLAEGRVKKEIAAQLNISPTTVISHVEHIYGKLNAPNAPAAIAKAFHFGILPIKKPV